MSRIASIALTALFALTGCGDGPPAPPVEVTERPSVIIGLVPELGIFRQYDRYEPVTDYLSRRTGIDIRLKAVSPYGSMIDDWGANGLDGGFMGSLVFVLAHERLGVEPVARPVRLDGASTCHGLVFARKDSGIKLYRDLMGKRLVFVDRATLTGYLLPLRSFHDFGMQDYRTVFAESYFAGTHEDAIRDVLDGRADVGAAKDTVIGQLVREEPRIGPELIFLARSPDVPETVLAVRGDLDAQIRSALARALLSMDEDDEGRRVLAEFGALRFVETTVEDYAPVHRYVAESGIDLASYDYVTR